MSSLSEIYFNYNQAIAQAKQLDQVASSLSKASSHNLNEIMNTVSRSWKSDSSPQYIKKGEKIGGDMQTTAGNLRNIASAIRSIAQRVMNAELEAWRIANARNG